MRLLELLRRESQTRLPMLLFMAGIAGISNAAILAIINSAAEQVASQDHSFRDLILFLIAILLYWVSQRFIMLTSAREVEVMLHTIRIRLMDKIRHADLQPIEQIGRSSIYASVAKETLTISNAATTIVMGSQSFILLGFVVIYLAWLSLTAFLIATVFTSIALAVHFYRLKEISRELHQASLQENAMLDVVTDMLEGFKESKMNKARSDDLYSHLRAISHSSTHLKIKTQSQQAVHFVLSQILFYLLVATMVFLVPRFTTAYADVILKLTTAILFMFGPLSMLVGAIPVLARANAAAENIFELENQLNQAVNPVETETLYSAPGFQCIELESLLFQYQDSQGRVAFQVGPVDLTLYPGEIIFIAGGNGAGKSTLLKLLLGLYFPSQGTIRVDGHVLSAVDFPDYRSLFAVVFSDYHLFKRLYGLQQPARERIEALLKDFELENKLRLSGGEFDTLDLSSGQRKRVALLVSLLEDRPVYVFDEWAADQDPEFRRKFYRELLQQLKQRGKTIIAATHDDRYFDVADRLLRMDYGRLSEQVQKQ